MSSLLAPQKLSKITVVTETDDEVSTLTGEVDGVSLDTKNNYEDIGYGFGSDYKSLSSQEVTVSGRLVGEYKIKTEKKAKTVVTKTASVLAEDRTVRAFEKARKLAGAPTNAKMRVADVMYRGGEELAIENLNSAWPVQVEFRWQEKF